MVSGTKRRVGVGALLLLLGVGLERVGGMPTPPSALDGFSLSEPAARRQLGEHNHAAAEGLGTFATSTQSDFAHAFDLVDERGNADAHGADEHAPDSHAPDAHGSDHGSSGGHGDAGHGAGAHAEGHHGPSPIDDEMALLLMLSLIALSVVFEKTKHHLEHSVDEHKHIILQALFGELTVLGFIALITFFLMDSGVFTKLSLHLYSDPQHLLHLFEKVHFGLFFVMILFLLLIGWLISVQHVSSQRWKALDKAGGEFLQEQRTKRKEIERRRQLLEQQATLEATTEARKRAQLDGEELPGGVPPPDMPPPSDEYLLSRYGQGGAVPIGLKAGYARQVDELSGLDLDEATDDWQLRKRDAALFAFLQLRQRFVFGMQGSEGRKIKLNDPKDTFAFGAYLTQCSAGITAEIVEVHPVTWILVAAGLAVVYVCNALLSHLGMCLVLVSLGWLGVGTMHLLQRTLQRLLSQLAPPSTASLAQIREGEPDAQPAYMGRPVSKHCNKHEALFPLGLHEEGPEWFCHTVRTVMLMCAVYLIGLQSVFGREMLADSPGVVGVLMLVLSLCSVLVVLWQLLGVFPLLVLVQSVGMMKKPRLVERTFRQQKLDLSLRLLKLLTSLQSQSRKLRKLKCKKGGADGEANAQSLEEVRLDRERAMNALDKNPTQKAELTAAFTLFDTSGDGCIEASELKGLLHSMGQKMSDSEAAQLLNEMDADNSGSVSLDEFLVVMASEVEDDADHAPTVEKLADDMFAMIDSDKSGLITFKEFRLELQKLPTGMTDEEIDELLQEMFGGGGDTMIDKHEFVHFIQHHKEDLGL